jgi:hypothetical protein
MGKLNCKKQVMLRFILFAALLASTKPGKFEGIWKADRIVLTILSDNPPRGTLARSGGGSLYIQDVREVKGALRFKIIDPSDGVIQFELKVSSPAEATLSIGRKETVTLRRN